MDDNRFDVLARMFGAAGSRRNALAVLLAVLGAHLLPVIDTEAGRGKGKGKDQGKGRSRGRDRDKHRGEDRKQKPARRTHAEAACFSGSPCVPGPKKNLAACDLGNSIALANANCTKCNLTSANLHGADASGANLNKANLSKACLVDADLNGANLHGANLSGAIFCRTTMPDASVNNAGCNKGTNCCPTCNRALGESCADAGDLCCGGAVCQSGACACPPSKPTDCGGTCTNLQSDKNNCGACGDACPQGQACQGGACGVACGAGFCLAGSADPDCCGGACTNTDTDPDHCGTCGTACGSCEVCDGSGHCVSTCPAGQICCGGSCTVPVWTNQTTFGSGGSGSSQFNVPAGVTVSADGQTAWVADGGNNRISIWTKSGSGWSNQTTFGSGPGPGTGQFHFPFGVAASADGQTVWVGDTENHRVSVWTESGGSWSNQTTFGSFGGGPDGLSYPQGVAASTDGQVVWVADSDNHRVSVWTKSGSGWVNETTFGSGPGFGANQFKYPYDVAVSADGQTVWVADTGNLRVSIWTKSGSSWVNQATACCVLDPFGVAVSADESTIWIADYTESMISVWTESGGNWTMQTSFGSGPGSDPSQLSFPTGVAVSMDELAVWVADPDNHRISIWGPGCPDL